MADENSGPTAPPPGILFPQDFDILLKLLPRAQIVVGDVPQILGTLQRLEFAAKSRRLYREVQPDQAEPERPVSKSVAIRIAAQKAPEGDKSS